MLDNAWLSHPATEDLEAAGPTITANKGNVNSKVKVPTIYMPRVVSVS
jgi:hypothetical protein